MPSRWESKVVNILKDLEAKADQFCSDMSTKTTKKHLLPGLLTPEIETCAYLTVCIWLLAKDAGNNAVSDCESKLRTKFNSNVPFYCPPDPDNSTYKDTPVFTIDWKDNNLFNHIDEGEILHYLRISLWYLDDILSGLLPKHGQNSIHVKLNHEGKDLEYHVFHSGLRNGYEKQTMRGDFTFSRTSLKNFRIVPQFIDNNQSVSIKEIGNGSDILSRSERPFRTLCVVFSLSEKISPQYYDEKGNEIDEPINNGSTFALTHINLSNKNQVIQRAFEIAAEEDCQAILFPELTIDDESLKQIKDLIRNFHISYAKNRKDPLIVVAGSWHKKHPTHNGNKARFHKNRSVILNSAKPSDSIVYEKRLSFEFKGNYESIILSDKIPIIFSPYGLLSIGICKDFLVSVNSVNQYSDLDVDYILVPSMGNDATTKSHESSLKSLYDSQKTLGIVAQQDPEPDKQTRGSVLGLQGKAKSWAKNVSPSDDPFFIWDSQKEQISKHS